MFLPFMLSTLVNLSSVKSLLFLSLTIETLSNSPWTHFAAAYSSNIGFVLGALLPEFLNIYSLKSLY